MNGVKLAYGEQIKRISGNIINFDQLVGQVRLAFSFKPEQCFKVCYLDKDKEKVEISNDDDFLEILGYHTNNCRDSVAKMEILLDNQLEKSINVEEMLSNMKLSESFTMIDKKDVLFSNSSPNVPNMVEEKEILMNDLDNAVKEVQDKLKKPSILNDESNYEVSEVIENTEVIKRNTSNKSCERGTQSLLSGSGAKVESKEIQSKAEMIDSSINTNQIFQKDEGIQKEMDKISLKESCVNTNKINVQDSYAQALPDISEERKENPSLILFKQNSFDKNLLLSEIKQNSKFNKEDSRLLDETLVEKIDEILSSRIKLMEENFRKMLQSQQEQLSSSNQNQNQNLQQNLSTNSNKDIEKSQPVYNPIPNINNNQIIPNENINLPPRSRPENQVEQIQHEIKISQNPIHSNELYQSSISSYDDNDVFMNEFCSSCKFQLISNKFICLLCEDYILCSKCEKEHTDHPLMKVNYRSKGISSKDELSKLLVSNYKRIKKQKGGMIKNIGKGIKGMFQSKDQHSVKLTPLLPTVFAMATNSKGLLTIRISNETEDDIYEEITIFAINNKRIKISSESLKGMSIGSSRDIILQIEAPDEQSVQLFEICANSKGEKSNYSNFIKFEINIVSPEDVDEANANLIFHAHEEILNLSKDKKIVLYKLINEGMTTRTIDDILKIMKKNQFDIALALDELTDCQEEEEEEGNWKSGRGPCYYGMDY
jgi:hypothetical protein